MLSTLSEQDETAIAWEATREDGPFFCPVCEEDVILKKGSIVIHHFAQHPESSCSYGTGESEQHRQAKYEIYEALKVHPSVSHLKEVLSFKNRYRADVCATYWKCSTSYSSSTRDYSDATFAMGGGVMP